MRADERFDAGETEVGVRSAPERDGDRTRLEAAVARGGPDALVAIDGDGNLVWANEAAEGLFGYRGDEMAGRSALSLVHPDDLWEATDSLRTTLARERVAGTLVSLRVRRSDGSFIPVEVRGANLLGEAEVGAVVLGIRDVSDRTDIGEARESTEARYHEILRHAAEVVLLLDADGTIRYTSPALTASTGWETGQLLGTDAMELVHPDDRDDLARAVSEGRGADVESVRAETRIRHRDGAWHRCEAELIDLLRDPAVGRLVLFLRDVTERRRVEAERLASERRFRSLVQHSSDVTVTYSETGILTYVSPAAERMLGYSATGSLGTQIMDLVHPEDHEQARQWAADLRDRPGDHVVGEIRLLHADGSWRVFEAGITNLLHDSAVNGFVANARDVTDRKVAEAARADADVRFRAAFESAPIGIAVQGLDGSFLQVNEALCTLLGRTAADLMGRTAAPLTHAEDRVAAERLRERAAAGELDRYQVERRYLRPDGHVVWARLNVSVVRNEAGEPDYAIAQIEDVTSRRRFEQRLAHQALHDALTGLPNRQLLLDRLEVGLERARRGGDPPAVLFCDLDRFKLVNDSLGHQAGDRLLVECAARLRSVVRKDDTVARFGGDEFVVLATDATDISEAVRLAERIALEMARPFDLEGAEFVLSTSIGIAIADDLRTTPDDLLRDADAAMYSAKEQGRDRWAVFVPELRCRARDRAGTEQALRRAVDDGGLELHYQPLVELGTGVPVGVEALLRWWRAGVLVPPAEFIPLAEETGLIEPIGTWVLERAVAQVAEWERGGLLVPDFVMAVNLSPRQLDGRDPVRAFDRALAREGVAAERLCFEVTESVIARDGERALAGLRRLRSRGARLAIDDFGTGYSALSHLKRFPFDTLKIDRTFVAGLGADPEDEAIVEAIVGVARALELRVVAEGVETDGQRRALLARGVGLGQGFLFGAAGPAVDVVRSFSPVTAFRPARPHTVPGENQAAG